MTHHLEPRTSARRRPFRTGHCRPTRSLAAGLAVLLLLAGATRPLRGQSKGELQVSALVLPVEPGRQARSAAIEPTKQGSNPLFRIRRDRRPDPMRPAGSRREELLVVVEFLAN